MSVDPNDEFNLFAGIQARDDGLEATKKKNREWYDTALGLMPQLPVGTEDIFEGLIRRLRDEFDLGPPPVGNVVGSLARRCGELGILAKTGRYVKMQKKTSHARESVIWRRI